jgi:hypothetical protein
LPVRANLVEKEKTRSRVSFLFLGS